MMAWVLDPVALNIIIGLGEIKAGDEILVDPHAPLAEGSTFVPQSRRAYVVTETRSGSSVTFSSIDAILIVDGQWFVSRRQIIGWRRPHG